MIKIHNRVIEYLQFNLWLNPAENTTLLVRANVLSLRDGVSGGKIKLPYEIILLPSTEKYLLIELSKLPLNLVEVINDLTEWTSLSDICNGGKLTLMMFTDGLKLPHYNSYIKVTTSGNVLIAINYKSSKVALNLKANIYVSFYTNHKVSIDLLPIQIGYFDYDTMTGSEYRSFHTEITNLTNAVSILLFLNGIFIGRRVPLYAELVEGDTLEYYYDDKLICVSKVDLLDCKPYTSTVDGKTKLIVFTEQDSIYIDEDDIEVFITVTTFNGKVLGAYYPRFTFSDLNFLTYKDYSLDANQIVLLQDTLNGFIATDDAVMETKIWLYKRKSRYNRPAILDSNRCFDLMNIPSVYRKRLIAGTTSYVDTWKASTLETSNFNKMRNSDYFKLTKNNSRHCLSRQGIIGILESARLAESGSQYPIGLSDDYLIVKFDTGGLNPITVPFKETNNYLIKGNELFLPATSNMLEHNVEGIQPLASNVQYPVVDRKGEVITCKLNQTVFSRLEKRKTIPIRKHKSGVKDRLGAVVYDRHGDTILGKLIPDVRFNSELTYIEDIVLDRKGNAVTHTDKRTNKRATVTSGFIKDGYSYSTSFVPDLLYSRSGRLITDRSGQYVENGYFDSPSVTYPLQYGYTCYYHIGTRLVSCKKGNEFTDVENKDGSYTVTWKTKYRQYDRIIRTCNNYITHKLKLSKDDLIAGFDLYTGYKNFNVISYSTLLVWVNGFYLIENFDYILINHKIHLVNEQYVNTFNNDVIILYFGLQQDIHDHYPSQQTGFMVGNCLLNNYVYDIIAYRKKMIFIGGASYSINDVTLSEPLQDIKYIGNAVFPDGTPYTVIDIAEFSHDNTLTYFGNSIEEQRNTDSTISGILSALIPQRPRSRVVLSNKHQLVSTLMHNLLCALRDGIITTCPCIDTGITNLINILSPINPHHTKDICSYTLDRNVIEIVPTFSSYNFTLTVEQFNLVKLVNSRLLNNRVTKLFNYIQVI